MLERIPILLGALIVLGLVFAVVERFWPSVRGQRRLRRGFFTDLTYFGFISVVARPLNQIVLFVFIAIVAAVFLGLRPDDLRGYAGRDTFFGRQPLGLQALELLLLGDLMGYWVHRAFHGFSRLWRIHAIHHSSTELDWLSAVRVHPLNDVLHDVVVVTPLFLLGFSPGALAAYVPLLTVYAILLHANVSWGFGPLRYVVASPRFHRWHHSAEAAALNKNFAGLMPLWDLVFGTLYLPRDVQPSRFGVTGEAPPAAFFGQLAHPFRRARQATAVAV